MKLNKKILLAGLGGILATTTPVVFVVSCGGTQGQSSPPPTQQSSIIQKVTIEGKNSIIDGESIDLNSTILCAPGYNLNDLNLNYKWFIEGNNDPISTKERCNIPLGPQHSGKPIWLEVTHKENKFESNKMTVNVSKNPSGVQYELIRINNLEKERQINYPEPIRQSIFDDFNRANAAVYHYFSKYLGTNRDYYKYLSNIDKSQNGSIGTVKFRSLEVEYNGNQSNFKISEEFNWTFIFTISG